MGSCRNSPMFMKSRFSFPRAKGNLVPRLSSVLGCGLSVSSLGIRYLEPGGHRLVDKLRLDSNQPSLTLYT